MTEPSSDPSPDPTSELSSTAGDTHPLHRRLKSFVKRGGRTTDGQAKAYADFGPKWLVPYRSEVLDLEAAFGRAAPTVLEIGFGMGEATAHIAKLLPDTNFLCCEVHEAGVGKLLKRCGEEGIGNVRIVAYDAVDVLDAMVLPGTLAGIHVFFPDPWHKKRHHKRRLIQPEFVAKLADRLQPGGYLHCATDWEPYAQQMLEVLSAEGQLTNTVDAGSAGYALKPDYRPLTKFEQRGLRLGHGVWDLVFYRA